MIAFAVNIFASQFTLVEFSTIGLDGNSGGPSPVFGSVTGPTSASYTGTSQATDGSYQQTYNGSGTASIGSLHASVGEAITCLSMSCGSYSLPASGTAGANYEPGISGLVWWNDILNVTPGPGLASLNFVFNVNGLFSQSGTANASDVSALLVGEDCAATETLCTGGPPPTPRNITQVKITKNGLVTVSLAPWVFNQPFDYEFILGVNASVVPTISGSNALINGASSASVDFSDTAQLIAVDPVDSQGNLITGTTIISASGVTLPGPVPEPSTIGCAGTGLLLIILGCHYHARRRKMELHQ